VFGWLQADTVAAVWTAAAAIHREKNTVEAAAAAGLQPQQAAANKLIHLTTLEIEENSRRSYSTRKKSDVGQPTAQQHRRHRYRPIATLLSETSSRRQDLLSLSRYGDNSDAAGPGTREGARPSAHIRGPVPTVPSAGLAIRVPRAPSSYPRLPVSYRVDTAIPPRHPPTHPSFRFSFSPPTTPRPLPKQQTEPKPTSATEEAETGGGKGQSRRPPPAADRSVSPMRCTARPRRVPPR
jgi:hypothetical protein